MQTRERYTNDLGTLISDFATNVDTLSMLCGEEDEDFGRNKHPLSQNFQIQLDFLPWASPSYC